MVDFTSLQPSYNAVETGRNAMSASVAVAESTSGAEIATLDALYEEAARLGFTPGWVRRQKPILWAEPKSEFVPAYWRWQDAKTALDAAGRLIDVALAERRNLVMRNPAGGANFETTRPLVCAYQMILPGEQAPSHRHSSHALRVIIDGNGSFSTVNGEKMPMETGDVVLTPGWCWHGHGHDGSEPAYWFDGLDVPLTHLLEPMFYEEHPDRHARIERVVTTSPFRFTRDTIARGLDDAKPDAEGFHGARISLAAPDMPPMGLAMERLEAGSKTRRYRSTANRIFLVTGGAGASMIGERRFVWQRGDTVVAPSWTWIEHHATLDSSLFTLTDEPLMRFCGYYRFEAE
jgi:gentisate 1,2-dioxygenase